MSGIKLKQVRIQNFRCLKDTGWVTLRDDITVLTGENDGGKTAFLHAIQCFLGGRKPDEADFAKAADEELAEEIRVYGNFTPSPDFLKACDELVSSQQTEAVVCRVFKREGGDDLLIQCKIPQDETLKVDFSKMKKADLIGFAVARHVDISGAKTNPQRVQVLETWRAKQPTTVGEQSLPKAAHVFMPTYQSFASADALDPDSEATRIAKGHFASIIRNPELSPKVDDVLGQAKADLHGKLDAIRQKILDYCDDLENVTVVPDFNFANSLVNCRLVVEKNGREVQLRKEGAGRVRKIALAMHEANLDLLRMQEEASSMTVLMYDEPDTHLDYKHQRSVFDVIREQAQLENVQVVVATHSLNFIDRVPITSIIQFALSDQGFTEVHVLETELDSQCVDLFLQGISESMGLKNSILLHERCFLMVEGDSEEQSLSLFFYKHKDMSFQAAGVCLLNGKNNCGALQLTKWLRNHGRNVVLLLDSDVLSDDGDRIFGKETVQILGMTQGLDLFFIGTKEYEDAFSDDVWAGCANAKWQRCDKLTWQAADFAALREPEKKFSKELRNMLAEKTKDHKLTKPLIAYTLANFIDAKDIPDQLTACFEGCVEAAR